MKIAAIYVHYPFALKTGDPPPPLLTEYKFQDPYAII